MCSLQIIGFVFFLQQVLGFASVAEIGLRLSVSKVKRLPFKISIKLLCWSTR